MPDLVDELAEELQHAEQERSTKDSLRLLRAKLLEEQGPEFFAELETLLRNRLEVLAERRPEAKPIIFDPISRSSTFTLRNPELRPAVKVTALLYTMSMLLRLDRSS